MHDNLGLYYPKLVPLAAEWAGKSYWQRRRFLRTESYPRFLYKFRAIAPESVESVKRMRSIVVESMFRLASPVDFNDPFDMSAHLVMEGPFARKLARIEGIVERHVVNKSRLEKRRIVSDLAKQSNDDLLKRAQAAHESARNTFGVYSFGGDARSTLMWSHYGGSHTGVCLQFEVAQDLETLLLAIAVKYMDEFPRVNWLDESPKALGDSLLRKHTEWKYEKEHRITIPNYAHRLLPFRPEALSGIIFGYRATTETRRTIDELLVERQSLGYPIPTLYAASRRPSKYSLIIKRC